MEENLNMKNRNEAVEGGGLLLLRVGRGGSSVGKLGYGSEPNVSNVDESL